MYDTVDDVRTTRMSVTTTTSTSTMSVLSSDRRVVYRTSLSGCCGFIIEYSQARWARRGVGEQRRGVGEQQTEAVEEQFDLDAMLDDIAWFGHRLRFEDDDWVLVRTCLISCWTTLFQSTPIESYDEKALEEVWDVDKDRAADREEGGVGVSGSSHDPSPRPSTKKASPSTKKAPKAAQKGSIALDMNKKEGGEEKKQGEKKKEEGRTRPSKRRREEEEGGVVSVRASGSRGKEDVEVADRGRKRARLDLEDSAGWCPTCHLLRAECFNVGDWACAECGQHNMHFQQLCTNVRCKETRRKEMDLSVGASGSTEEEELEMPPPRASSPWCLSCKKLKIHCYKMNDWECLWCGNHNFARKQVVHGNNSRLGFSIPRVCLGGPGQLVACDGGPEQRGCRERLPYVCLGRLATFAESRSRATYSDARVGVSACGASGRQFACLHRAVGRVRCLFRKKAARGFCSISLP